MKKVSLVMFLLFCLAPHAADAKVPGTDHFYKTEPHLAATVRSRVPEAPTVLGASTQSRAVPAKLGATYRSYFRDLTFKAPAGWYTDDDYDGLSKYTFAMSEDTTAQISIERGDAEGATLQDVVDVMSSECTCSGFETVGTGTSKISGMKGSYIEVTNGDYHKKLLIFVKKDTYYVIELLTEENDWKPYKAVLEKSANTIKVK